METKANWNSTGGAIGLLGAAVALVIGICFLIKGQEDTAVRLPLLAIGGVVTLLVVIALVAGAYTLFNLANPAEALGLPEGSVRAIIALSLIVLFAILTVYLYSDISKDQIKSMAGLTQSGLDAFLLNMPAQRVISTIDTATQGGAPQFTVYYYDGSAAGHDFAKQLLVMIGTLMTSVTSFYFATKPPATANGSGSGSNTTGPQVTPAPVLTGITPPNGARGSAIAAEIAGTHLGEVTAVKLILGADEIAATAVTATEKSVKCTFALPAQAQQATWTVKVTDKSGKTAELQKGFTVS